MHHQKCGVIRVRPAPVRLTSQPPLHIRPLPIGRLLPSPLHTRLVPHRFDWLVYIQRCVDSNVYSRYWSLDGAAISDPSTPHLAVSV